MLCINGRVILRELKCGNIKSGMEERAWEMVFMGQLASRYLVLLTDSISTTAFFTEQMDNDVYTPDKVIQLEPLRDEFVQSYMTNNINRQTHPVMRRHDDPECDDNVYKEMAKVASICCIHQCFEANCGGKQNGDGCMFGFPRPMLKYTVPAVVQINAEQMEVRMLPRSTCGRVSNCNKLLLRFLRSNHDMQVLVDASHKLRYAAKYASKSERHEEIMKEIVQHVNDSRNDPMPVNTKQCIESLIAADCGQRQYISKCELSYKVVFAGYFAVVCGN